MMTLRNLRAMSLALLLGAVSAVAAMDGRGNDQELEQALVSYAASDFASSGARPDGFRQVDLRFRENDQGARTFLLCGQAHLGEGAKAEWVDFATIKTDPYEQWLGGAATDMCARATAVPPSSTDLPLALEAALARIPPAASP